MVFTIGLSSVVCGVWKLVGVQRLEGSLIYIYIYMCAPRELRVDQTRTVYQFLAPHDPLLCFLRVALTNESTVSGDSTGDVCASSSTCEKRCCDYLVVCY